MLVYPLYLTNFSGNPQRIPRESHYNPCEAALLARITQRLVRIAEKLPGELRGKKRKPNEKSSLRYWIAVIGY